MSIINQMRLKRITTVILLTALICTLAILIGSGCTRSTCPTYEKVWIKK
jgi:hypothetical protein